MTQINLIRDRQESASSRCVAPLRWRWLFALVVMVGVHAFQSLTVSSLHESRDRLRSDLALRHAARRARAAAIHEPPLVAQADGDAAALARRLRHLAASLPHDLWIVGYREHTGEVTVEGLAHSDDAVRALARELPKTGNFRDVQITETIRRDERGWPQYSFTLVAGVCPTRARTGGGSPAN